MKNIKIRKKILMLEILLMDIRSHWDFSQKKRAKDKRVKECLRIIDTFGRLTNEGKFSDIENAIPYYQYYQSIGLYLTGRVEGRLFNNSSTNGGYEGLKSWHGFEMKLSTMPKKIKKKALSLCRSDWDFFHQ